MIDKTTLRNRLCEIVFDNSRSGHVAEAEFAIRKIAPAVLETAADICVEVGAPGAMGVHPAEVLRELAGEMRK